MVKFSFWYWLIPSLLFVLLFVVTIYENSVSGFVWTYNWWRWIVFPGIAFIIGLIIFLVRNTAEKRTGDGVVYWSRDECDALLKKELNGKSIDFQAYSDLNDSFGRVGNFGEKTKKTLIYHGLLRTTNVFPQYILFAMCMEKGKEDRRSFEVRPQNLTMEELTHLRIGMCNELADSPESPSQVEKIMTDPFTGQNIVERSNYRKDEDKDEDEE